MMNAECIAYNAWILPARMRPHLGLGAAPGPRRGSGAAPRGKRRPGGGGPRSRRAALQGVSVASGGRPARLRHPSCVPWRRQQSFLGPPGGALERLGADLESTAAPAAGVAAVQACLLSLNRQRGGQYLACGALRRPRRQGAPGSASRGATARRTLSAPPAACWRPPPLRARWSWASSTTPTCP